MTQTQNKIPKDWKTTTLGEVAEFCYGKMPDREHIVLNGQYPIYSGYQKVGYYDEFNSDEDLIVVARGVGGTGDVKISPKKSFVTNLSIIIKLDINKVDKKYLFYKYLINNLRYLDSGSAQSQIVISDLKNIQLFLPPIPEQRAIARVLSSFDDKIELLREQNKTLEATAQAIFKEWFVKFNFPNDKGKPYKDSGGKMVESELGEIPEGWRVGRLGDFGEIICGKTPSKNIRSYFGGNIPFIKIPDMHGNIYINKTEDSLTIDGANTQKNKSIPSNSICVSCIATVGLVSITSELSQTNQQINSIVPKLENYLEYLFLALKNMKDDLLAIGTGGSATLNINTTTFSNIDIIFPKDSVLENYHNTTSAMFRKLNFNNSQIQTLSILRDALLPKLMKGEVRVKNL